MLLLPLLALACFAHALPVEPDVLSSADDVHANGEAEPHVVEADVDSVRAVDTPASDKLVRERRSPFQPRPQPQGQGQGRGQGQEARGTVTGGVHRERGVGTVVHAQGEGTVWRSRDGRTSVDAHGQYERVVRGPARGRPNYNVGVRVQHRF
ncbi:hypothetical protein R5R35_007406 [Gryllus longicercus]|uniref:Attacin C-terminal domain-containing protein n=1 Tax=Gryllus longicercus TaxID=2509291 RepID=A0AAN9VXT6_9ORTH